MAQSESIWGVILAQGTDSKKDTDVIAGPGRRKGVTAYSKNPFWEAQEVKVGSKMIKVAGGQHVTPEGESVAHSGIHVVRHVDETEFVKLYTSNVKAIFDLKPTSLKVLQYLMVKLQETPNADAVYLAWFGAEEYFNEEDVKMSRRSFHRALSEMVEKGFIAESKNPHMFWFNPHLFFNGSRMSFVQEYRKNPKPA